jgi:hypothetical protein
LAERVFVMAEPPSSEGVLGPDMERVRRGAALLSCA